MTIIITDATIVAHCRAKGMVGPIDRRFVKEYRNSLAVCAMGLAARDAGVPLPDLARNVAPHIPAINRHLEQIAAEL